jgi:ectoine hydroxylase-related dioxygenase (phytanoyl-CoA dioxygenase family)
MARDDFERDGAVIVRGVVDPAELAAMHDAFATLIPEGAYPGGVREITGAARAWDPLKRIARDPRFGAIAAEMLGAARVQLLQDSLLYKPAHDGGPVEWHQDHTYVGFLVPARVVSLRIALFAEDASNGCMEVVDGSHRWGPIGESRALRDASVASLAPALDPERRAELDRPRALVLAAGDVSVHHCLTLHRSGVNHSARPRRTIILRMFDAECRLDATRLPEGASAHFPTDGDGHLVASAFPITHGA